MRRTPRTMAPHLLWIHGSGYTQDSFRDQVAAFPQSDALSLPGHPQGEPLTTVADMAAWLNKYIDWKGGGKAVVGGNSLGGAIALEWALRRPRDVAGLILIGTGARLRVSPAIFEMLDARWPESIPTFADYALAPSASADLRGRVEEWHRLAGRQATRADYAACDAWDIMDRVAEIKAPTLIIVGELDRLTPPKFSRFLSEKIAGSRLLEVAGAGHVAMAERPDIVNPAIRAFIASLRR